MARLRRTTRRGVIGFAPPRVFRKGNFFRRPRFRVIPPFPVKGNAAPRCYTRHPNTIMKTSSTLLLAASLCLPLPAFAVDATADYVPMKMVQTEPVIFPSEAHNLGVREGEAHVSVAVDENGKITDYLVTAYTHPAFADAAVNALRKWEFEPAYVQGKPRNSLVDLAFSFESKGVSVVSLDVITYVEQLNYHLHPGTYRYHVSTLRELDHIPTPTKVVRPAYAIESAKHQTGVVTITVQFFIDETGHVRMPSVTRETDASNALLAAAAVAAVSQWEFEPPMSHGHPVLVEARQDFNFKPKT